MKRLILIYNILILTLLFISDLFTAGSLSESSFNLLLLPMIIYFIRVLIGPFASTHKMAQTITQSINIVNNHTHIQQIMNPAPVLEAETVTSADIQNLDRRMFLKLIGSASLSAFFLSLFTGKADAAFFGSLPVPGTMSVKNASGVAIDPAEKQPTDGYEITDIDDTSSPAYYGFLHKTGAWYISREEATGAYRYTKGMSDFPSNWTNRATLTYDYFDNVF